MKIHGDNRSTVVVPITTVEEMPLLSEEDRAQMITSLKKAEADIAAGEYVAHNPDTFVEHLLAIRDDSIRKT